MSILEANIGDEVKVWLADGCEPKGGIWVINTVKEHNGELCLWENGWKYNNTKQDPPLPLSFFKNDKIEFLTEKTQ